MLLNEDKELFKKKLRTMLAFSNTVNAVLINAGNVTRQNGTKTYALFIWNGEHIEDVTYDIGKLLSMKVVYSEARNTGVVVKDTNAILDIKAKLTSLLKDVSVKIYIPPMPSQE